jgi:fructose-bisphosphate aldolase class II
MQSMVPMLRRARSEGYAVGLFDAHNLEGILAIVDAAIEQRSPVIIAPFAIPFRAAIAFIREAVAEAPVPIAIELDHGQRLQTVLECVRAGFTDVMFDASAKPYEENAALTRHVAKVAHMAGLGVEGEIGHVGRGVEYDTVAARRATLTRSEDAARFVTDTGVDALAVAIGTVHGIHGDRQELDLERLREIYALVDVPLVLHGGSGLSDDEYRALIANGISKINIYTNMAQAAIGAIRESLADPGVGYARIQENAYKAIKAVVVHCMQVFGSAGKV